jgi:SAM-dependent methyltransferase
MRVDPDSDDDSAIGGFSDMSSVMSASSSVYDFVNDADGRRYHRYREGKYMMPNDETEQDRLNLQHQLWLMTLDSKLSLAPLKKEPEQVLDLGTGTGIWAVEYAAEHPSAKVVGSDLSPIQPNFIPSNCSFEIFDFEDEWTYSQRFDLIHARLLVSGFANPKRTFEQAFTALSPGGFLEMQDTDCPGVCDDGTISGTALEKWYGYVTSACLLLGKDLTMAKNYKSLMEEVGFVNVEEKTFIWPTNTWPKDQGLKKLGPLVQKDLVELVEGFKQPFLRGLGWTLEEVEAFQEEVKRDLRDRRIHAYLVIRVVTGMKPE